MNFEARLFDARTGLLTQTLLSAATPEQALVAAQAGGMRVLSIRALPQAGRSIGWRRSEKRDYPLLCRELRTLLVAGMSVVEAIDTLSEFDLRGNRASTGISPSLASMLRAYLQQGLSLSKALGSMEGVPPVLLACVRSVEHTSNLLEALDDYLRYHDMMANLRSKIISAAIYPAIVSGLGLLIMLFLLIVVLPQFAQMYGQLRGQARGLTHLVIALSQWIVEHQLLFTTGLTALLSACVWVLTSASGLRLLGAWAWRAGWVRARVMDHQLALFYQALHLLSKGGYALSQALQIASTAAVSSLLQDQVLSCQQAIEKGRSVSASLHSHGLATEVDRRLLAAAEDNGEFSQVARAISELHQSRFELMIERMTRLAEPALLMLVALMVGTVVVVMYMPIFEMGVMSR